MTNLEPTPPTLNSYRGGSVDVDVRRIVEVLLAIILIGVAVLSIVLIVSDVHSNNQVNELHNDGVPVTVTVTGCLGLLGGSGSNAAGNACTGYFTVNGHRYHEAIPGSTFYRPGATFYAVRVPGDPALFASVSTLSHEHASWTVFIIPSILLLVVILVGGFLLMGRKRGSTPSPSDQSTS
jgi:hypothetical protein